jgi:hypothetical protein
MGVSTTSCTKSNLKDTVFSIVRDTTIKIIRDTTHSYDTIYYTPSKNPIVGHWAGSYFINGDAVDSFMYTFDIRPDGTVYSVGSGINQTAGYASGPWTLSGVNFSATLTTMAGVSVENIQTVTAKYDSVTGRLTNGVWIDTRGNGGLTGTFTMMRVP